MNDHRSPNSDDLRSTSSGGAADDPIAALENLRRKMEDVASEFAQGKINRAQFNAVYGRYSEQRNIIERLVERNPQNPAWKQVAAPGHTGFLRSHFEARAQYYLIYKRDQYSPLMGGGKQKPDAARMGQILKTLWKSGRRNGVARMSLPGGKWLVLALGDTAVTIVMFMLEPSITQINRVRDLHADFERANHMSIERNLPAARMVFPQRALVE